MERRATGVDAAVEMVNLDKQCALGMSVSIDHVNAVGGISNVRRASNCRSVTRASPDLSSQSFSRQSESVYHGPVTGKCPSTSRPATAAAARADKRRGVGAPEEDYARGSFAEGEVASSMRIVCTTDV